MTESGETAPVSEPTQEPKKRGSLNALRIADLKAMAGGLGIAGAESMRKAQLVDAIKAQGRPVGERAATRAPSAGGDRPPPQDRQQEQQDQQQEQQQEQQQRDVPGQGDAPKQRSRQRQPKQDQPKQDQPKQDQPKQDQQARQPKQDQPKSDQQAKQPKQDQQPKQRKAQQEQDHAGNRGPQDGRDDDQDEQDGQDGDGTGSRRNRRRRGRDNRDGNQRPARRGEPDTQVLEDDVLVPAAGILDVLENYAFVRTSGYLPGSEDVYLSLSLVRKFGLRRGDAVKGQVRQPREGERREKFNPMVRIDSVNGADAETARTRPEFDDLTAVHPTERIRLETGPDDLVGRVLDLAVPLGKGQRCLVQAPPRSGRTALLRSLAESITTNCADAHLMVVLLHERPEEVTDFRRDIAGEVIASSFDRQPADHAGVAELAIERAKRLVELGHEVVVLLDGLTRLARAHNHAGAGAGGGRMLPGGVDAAALLPPKRFFGAGRALEEGGSLTVIATVSVDTASPTDDLVAEELEGTANAEIRLSRALAGAGMHPAVDLLESGTRHDDLLLGQEERDAVERLRGVLAGRADAAAALGLLLERVRATRTNLEMLTRVTRGPR